MKKTVLAFASLLIMAPAPALAQFCEITDDFCGEPPPVVVHESQSDCQAALRESRRGAPGDTRGPQRCVLVDGGYVIQ